MRRFLISLLVVLNLFGFAVFAETAEPTISLPKDFLLYSQNKTQVSEILKTDKEELDKYCLENNISQFAIDKDNLRQIKLLSYENEFSKATQDFDFFSEKELEANMGTIIGHKEKRPMHSIVTAQEQRFIKTEYFDKDESGSFKFTQYFTVEDSKNYCLVFLTNENADTSYINSVFEDFAKNEIFSKQNSATDESHGKMTTTIILIVAVSAVAAAILFTVIRDIIKSKKASQEETKEADEN